MTIEDRSQAHLFPKLDVVLTLTDLRGDHPMASWRFPWENNGEDWLRSQRFLLAYTVDAVDTARAWRSHPDDLERLIPWIRAALDVGDTSYAGPRVVGPSGVMLVLVVTYAHRRDGE